MSEAKNRWTEGPWRLDPEALPAGDYVTARKGVICRLYSRDTEEPLPQGDPVESVANAHLIAAAPDLYGALEDLAEGWPGPALSPTLRRARAALAKARGDDPTPPREGESRYHVRRDDGTGGWYPGAAMGDLLSQRAGREAVGVVLFARGRCPSWVAPLFQLSTTPSPLTSAVQRVLEAVGDLAKFAPREEIHGDEERNARLMETARLADRVVNLYDHLRALLEGREG